MAEHRGPRHRRRADIQPDKSEALANGGTQLILLITGDAPRSRRARENLAAALRDLKITDTKPTEVDLIKQPAQTLVYGVFATPALLRTGTTGKAEALYGDLSERKALERFLAGL